MCDGQLTSSSGTLGCAANLRLIMKTYDLIVIGSGPGGEKAAIKAAYYGKRVALVEKEARFGGAGYQTGTVPSKTLKETAIYLSGIRERGVYGVERKLDRKASVEDFFFHKNHVSELSSDEIQRGLQAHQVDIVQGKASFIDAKTIQVDGLESVILTAPYILIATGSYPNHPENIPFDGEHIHDSDSILHLKRFPQSLVVVGAGVIGCEYASLFAAMGCDVTLVNSRENFLTFLDEEMVGLLRQYMEENGVRFLFGARTLGVEITSSESGNHVCATLADNTQLVAEMFLYAAGRNGNIRHLNLDAAGIDTGPRETILVNEHYETNVPGIYAVGDVIGFPALASTSMDQGRVAVAHMFSLKDLTALENQFPYGIYTIPEVSCVGLNEADCREQGIEYGVGRAEIANMARGRIMGYTKGMLKLVYEKHSRTILGVHITAAIATELIHFGMLLVQDRVTLNRVISMVYNFPTLHELYKYAAYDAFTQQGEQLTRHPEI